MKLKSNLLWNVEFQLFLASFPHRDFHFPQTPSIWLIALDASSLGQNLVSANFFSHCPDLYASIFFFYTFRASASNFFTIQCPWFSGGLYLLEINRILRPGGFWVLSGPPVNYENRWRGWNTTVEEQRADFEKLQELLTSMCFKLYNKKDDIAVWQKSMDDSCYKKLDNPDIYPSKCDDSLEPDAAWYTPLRSCVVVPDEKNKKAGLKYVPKWPERLHSAPERLRVVDGGSASAFKHDDKKWQVRMKHYKKLLPAIGTDKIRNVMDMNTLYGGFAAAVADDPLWVMNVVSSYAPNTLPIVFDRGLVGTYHDW